MNQMSEDERRALLKVRAILEAEVVSHLDYRVGVPFPTTGSHFTMCVAHSETGYGTVACIGGWMAEMLRGADALGNVEPEDYVSEADHMNGLFFPDVDWSEWRRITPKMAVEAIDNFLETGDPKWREVLET